MPQGGGRGSGTPHDPRGGRGTCRAGHVSSGSRVGQLSPAGWERGGGGDLDGLAEVAVGAQGGHVMRLQRQRLSPQVLRVSPSSSSPFHGRVAAPGRRPTGTIAAAVKVVSRPRGEEGCVLA